ncbi:MFS multidrug transporter [Pseudohyphozyma bogoriensis]|nr:MFS multidrug transporter [Pseudohyphozyma bogoriensis]
MSEQPIAFTVIFPFVIAMVQDSGVTDDPRKVGYYAGLIESVFAFCGFLTILQWGRLSDRIGRKPVLMIGLSGVAASTLAFGFSKSFAAILTARIIGGLLNGNVAVIKSMMGEITDETNQAQAFAVLPLAWSLGSIFGPILGGFASHPAETFPKIFGSFQLFKTYPYALPCLIGACFPVVGVVLGALFLKETLTKETNDDVSSAAHAAFVAKTSTTVPAPSSSGTSTPASVEEGSSILREKPPPLSALCTPRIASVLLVYAFLALQTVSMDAILVLVASTRVSLGGLGLTTAQLGTALSGAGVATVFCQFLLFPALQRRFGTTKYYRILMGMYPFIFCLFPLMSYYAREDAGLPKGEDKRRVWATLWAFIVLKSFANQAYGTNMLTVTTAAPSRRLLGAMNGVAQMSSSLMRSIGPIGASSLFAYSLSHNAAGGWLAYYVLIGVCTPMPKKTRVSAQARTGKRIDHAKAMFGAKDYEDGEQMMSSIGAQPPSTSQSSFPATKTVTTTLNNPTSSELTFLQPSSLSNRIDALEMQGAVVSSLMDFFLNYGQARSLLVENTNFRTAFEQGGRRIDAMEAQTQVLCSVVIALAARSSDLPMLVGSSAPRVYELTRIVGEGQDLTPYGASREAACSELLQRAIRLADQHGTLRTPTTEAVAALQILEGLLEPDDNEVGTSTAYSAGYISHTRKLLAQESEYDFSTERDRKIGRVLAYNACYKDAMIAMKTGVAPSFSEEDMYLLREGDDPPPPLEQAVLMNVGPVQNFWTVMLSQMETGINLARKASKNLTGVFARRAPRLNEAFVEEFIAQVHVILSALPILHQRGEELSQVTSNRTDGTYRDTWSMVRSLRVSASGFCFFIHRIVLQRITARNTSSAKIVELGPWPMIPGPMDEDEEYWNRLQALQTRTKALAFLGARNLAQVFSMILKQGIAIGSPEALDVRGVQMIFSSLPLWIPAFLETPVTEEGGPEGFDYNTKIEELTWISKAIRGVGWSFYRLGRSAQWIQTELAILERRRTDYWQNFATTLGAGAVSSPSSGTSTSSPSTTSPPGMGAGPPTAFSDQELQAILSMDFSSTGAGGGMGVGGGVGVDTGLGNGIGGVNLDVGDGGLFLGTEGLDVPVSSGFGVGGEFGFDVPGQTFVDPLMGVGTGTAATSEQEQTELEAFLSSVVNMQ